MYIVGVTCILWGYFVYIMGVFCVDCGGILCIFSHISPSLVDLPSKSVLSCTKFLILLHLLIFQPLTTS